MVQGWVFILRKPCRFDGVEGLESHLILMELMKDKNI
jgi:hypothetical protein